MQSLLTRLYQPCHTDSQLSSAHYAIWDTAFNDYTLMLKTSTAYDACTLAEHNTDHISLHVLISATACRTELHVTSAIDVCSAHSIEQMPLELIHINTAAPVLSALSTQSKH
jgi:hypothetical protein